MIKKISSLNLIPIGKFGKTHGVTGEISVISFTENPEDILNYTKFYNSDKNLLPITFRKANKKIISKIVGISTLEEASDLIHREIFIEESEMPKLKENEFYWKDIIGCEVKNSDGEFLGTVTKLENHGSSDILFIDNGKNEILVPYISNFILDCDLKKKLILVEWSMNEN
mgnify:FL=1